MPTFQIAALIFFTAVLPTLGSSVAIPMGIALGFHPLPITVLAVVGALCKVPLAIFLAAEFHRFASRLPWMGAKLGRIEARTQEQLELLRSWGWPALTLCSAIPVPGFGIWTAAFAGRLLGFNRVATGLALAAGLVISGVGMALVSVGIIVPVLSRLW